MRRPVAAATTTTAADVMERAAVARLHLSLCSYEEEPDALRHHLQRTAARSGRHSSRHSAFVDMFCFLMLLVESHGQMSDAAQRRCLSSHRLSHAPD